MIACHEFASHIMYPQSICIDYYINFVKSLKTTIFMFPQLNFSSLTS